MKKVFVFLILANIVNIMFAQNNSNTVGKIALSVIMPDNVEGLNESQLSKLQNKITQIVSNSGLAASGYNNNFVIYPKFSISESSVVESGMQDLTIINCDLTLIIKQVENNVIFATINKQLKGNGKSNSLAISNVLTKINTSDQDYKNFIEIGKTKIIQYYESKCSDILLKSESLAKMKQYEEAVGLLMSVPEEVPCFVKVQAKSIETYKLFQIQQCKSQLQQAKSEFAANKYNAGLQILSQIDPSTPCYIESQSMFSSIANKVDQEEKKQWEYKMKQHDDNVALEKMRVDAVKEIAVSYYKSRTNTINYSVIVK